MATDVFAKIRAQKAAQKAASELTENAVGQSLIPSSETQLANAVELDATEQEKSVARKKAIASFFNLDKSEIELIEEINKQVDNTEIQSIDPTESSTDIKSRDDIVFNAQQLAGIQMAIDHPYSNLIGYAGTGKTTTVLEMVRQLINDGKIREMKYHSAKLTTMLNHIPRYGARNFNFVMCAFTGLAVKSLRRAVPNEYKSNCCTIHKLIDFGPVKRDVYVKNEKTGTGGWQSKIFFEPRIHNGKWVNDHGYLCNKADYRCSHLEEEPQLLQIDHLIIDEASMVGIRLWKMLIDAIPPWCKITTIGDIAQIPPVLDVPVQPLLLGQWPTTELTKIYRQKDGDIISNAHAIRQGRKPVASECFKLKAIDKSSTKAQKQVLAYIQNEMNEGRYDPKQDILITPMNVGNLGQEILNIMTRTFANPTAKIKLVSTMRGKKKFAVGDRVMNIKNDNEIGIYNGMLGWIDTINPQHGVKNNQNADLEQDDEVSFDLTAAVDELQAEQKRAKQSAKAASMFGSLYQGMQEVTTEEEEGTGVRRSSHVIGTQFDFEVEDDPDGTKHKHYLNSSSQIENLIPAWWITIHKSQGSGFRNVYIVLHNDAAVMLCNELLYTAITRCMENVTILSTKYALNKCISSMRIKGETLQEKVQSYVEQFDMSKYPYLKIPKDSDYQPKVWKKVS